MKKYIIYGDIHGCLGDLVDRGPDSVATVQLAIDHGIRSIMGNHEYKYEEKTHNSLIVYDIKDPKHICEFIQVQAKSAYCSHEGSCA